jgi:hypothetical protein
MARKTATIEEEAVETVEVVVNEQPAQEAERPLSPQTLAEMEAGRQALADRAASAKAEIKQ